MLPKVCAMIEDPEKPDEEELEDGAEGEDSEGGDDGEDGEGKKKKGGKKKLLFVLVPLVLLIGGGAAAYFLGVLDPLIGGGEEAHGDEHAGGKKDDGHGKKDDGHGDGHGGEGAFLAVPPVTVNLQADDGSPKYLRLTVQLELESAGDADAIRAIMPRVIDQFQTYLRELRVSDLRGSAGIYRLQLELLRRVNQAAAPVKIKDVLFQEILIN